jgi:hypothetical protein
MVVEIEVHDGGLKECGWLSEACEYKPAAQASVSRQPAKDNRSRVGLVFLAPPRNLWLDVIGNHSEIRFFSGIGGQKE